jgi:hypothetical protein
VVPHEVRGTDKLRFLVVSLRRHALRAARFRLDGRTVRQHAREAALTAGQLATDGVQTLTVTLVPQRGRAVTLRIPFRTRSA